MENKPKVKHEWHAQQEKILKKWAEVSSSYRYLHDRSYALYSQKNLYFALPVIILSTITGTANFAQSSFPASIQPYAPSMIGTLNLVAGLITTVSQFLRVSELLESHRVASLAFGKLSRNIAVELSLPIKERTTDGTAFLSACRVELDKLIEQSLVFHLIYYLNSIRNFKTMTLLNLIYWKLHLLKFTKIMNLKIKKLKMLY